MRAAYNTAALAGLPARRTVGEADLRLIEWLRRELSLCDYLPIGVDATASMDELRVSLPTSRA